MSSTPSVELTVFDTKEINANFRVSRFIPAANLVTTSEVKDYF